MRDGNSTNDRKAWYASKTIWINTLIGIIAGFSAVASDGKVQDAAAFTLIAAIANLILRYLTDKPISVRGRKRRR